MQFQRPVQNVSRPDNFILANLPEEEFAKLSKGLVRVSLPLGFRFFDPGMQADFVYFPIAGVVSTTAVTEAGEVVEIGMTGSEGLVSVLSILGQPETMHSTVMQIEGEGFRIKAAVTQELIKSGGKF